MKLVLTLLVLGTLATQPPPPMSCTADWPHTTAALEQAVLNDDATTLKGIRAACLQSIAAGLSADRVPLTKYAVAYADWRMSTNPLVPAREQNDLLDEADTQLQDALTLNARFAEADGLLAGVLGIKIAKSPMRGMVLGRRSSQLIDRAIALEPENPRILMQQGVAKFNTPAMFGGSTKQAETLLRRALALFEHEPADRPWPNWGRFDAHVWLGQALVKRGDLGGARAEYDRAAALAPRSGWLRFVLVPQLEKAGK